MDEESTCLIINIRIRLIQLLKMPSLKDGLAVISYYDFSTAGTPSVTHYICHGDQLKIHQKQDGEQRKMRMASSYLHTTGIYDFVPSTI